MTTCRCGNPILYGCRWKLRQPFMIWANDLREGDRMQIPGGLGYNLIHRITPGEMYGWICIVFAFAKDAQLPVSLVSPVMVMRVGECGAPCCDACSREVSDGHHYCLAHWDAWERVGERGEVEQTQQLE